MVDSTPHAMVERLHAAWVGRSEVLEAYLCRPIALVRGYLQIDANWLHAVLNEHLEEIREFARCVDEYAGKAN